MVKWRWIIIHNRFPREIVDNDQLCQQVVFSKGKTQEIVKIKVYIRDFSISIVELKNYSKANIGLKKISSMYYIHR